MSKFPDALYLNVSPSLQRFHEPLLKALSQRMSVGVWEYSQTPDEPTALNLALVLLHDYLKSCDRPVHLIGHSIGGWLGLLYAHRYQERVKSLTLLAVAPEQAMDWQDRYYTLLQVFPCSRETILMHMVYYLFGYQSQAKIQKLIQILEQDLLLSPSPHNLFHPTNIPAVKISVPLLVCGSSDDIVVDPYQLHEWKSLLNEGDRLWECPQGRHFFHYFYPQLVCEQMLNFYQTLWDRDLVLAGTSNTLLDIL